MARPQALLDASVLCQEPVRSLLLWIAAEGGYEPFWTRRILEETERSLLDGGVVVPAQWDRLRAAMSTAFPEAMLDQVAVDAIEDKMPNHQKDRHVLAAAVVGGIKLVVTNNLRHFEAEDLTPIGKRSLDADAFLCELLGRSPHIVNAALNQQVAHMRRPCQWTLTELLGRFGGQGSGDPLAPNFAITCERLFSLEAKPPPIYAPTLRPGVAKGPRPGGRRWRC